MQIVTAVSLIMIIFSVSRKYFVVPNSATEDAHVLISFQYFSTSSQHAAASLLQVLLDLDARVLNLQGDLQNTSEISLFLNKYKKTLELATYTDCFPVGKDQSRISQATKQILLAIETCKTFAPQGRRAALKEVIFDSVIKLQSYDNQLRLTAYVCAAPGFPPSERCVKYTQKALDGIRRSVSDSNMGKFGILARNAFIHTKKVITLCVTISTGNLRDYINAWITEIDDCLVSIKHSQGRNVFKVLPSFNDIIVL